MFFLTIFRTNLTFIWLGFELISGHYVLPLACVSAFYGPKVSLNPTSICIRSSKYECYAKFEILYNLFLVQYFQESESNINVPVS